MMKYIITLLSFLIPSISLAEFHIIELEKLRIDYMWYKPGSRNPLITQNAYQPNRTMTSYLGADITTTVLKYGYVNTLVHSAVDGGLDGSWGQYRLIGLQVELGVRLLPFLDLFMYHHSQHLLDTEYSYGRFPSEDAFGIHVNIFDKYKKPATSDLFFKGLK